MGNSHQPNRNLGSVARSWKLVIFLIPSARPWASGGVREFNPWAGCPRKAERAGKVKTTHRHIHTQRREERREREKKKRWKNGTEPDVTVTSRAWLWCATSACAACLPWRNELTGPPHSCLIYNQPPHSTIEEKGEKGKRWRINPNKTSGALLCWCDQKIQCLKLDEDVSMAFFFFWRDTILPALWPYRPSNKIINRGGKESLLGTVRRERHAPSPSAARGTTPQRLWKWLWSSRWREAPPKIGTDLMVCCVCCVQVGEVLKNTLLRERILLVMIWYTKSYIHLRLCVACSTRGSDRGNSSGSSSLLLVAGAANEVACFLHGFFSLLLLLSILLCAVCSYVISTTFHRIFSTPYCSARKGRRGKTAFCFPASHTGTLETVSDIEF